MNDTRPDHCPMDQFSVVDDCLQLGGQSLVDLAARIGQTPFYAYDRDAMTRRVALLRRSLPDGLSLHYAIKANPMPAVVQHMAGQVDGLDVASQREMQVALDTGTRPDDISFAGPGKSVPELEAAVAAGITINLESPTELERVGAIAARTGYQARVAVRVNPDFELKSSGMRMSGGPKAFGIDAERVPDLLARIGELGLHFRGFHIFSGSQNLRPETLVEAQGQTFELALRLAESAPGPVEMLNIGGGFGIPYFPGDQPLDLGPVAEHLEGRLPAVRDVLPDAEIILELGRYLVGEAGIYVAEVLDRKESRGQVFLVTNGGLHHHLAASGNFGQVIRKNYPVVVGNRVRGTEREVVNVVGPLCTPLDVLAQQMELARADVGDLIVVFQSGAYGYTASPTRFLSHPEPVEILV
ncbi:MULTISPECIES: pyridoxal-dependent decarboxylase, exosortase A system-associated [unclassified Thioalkalivibrio]|uniref:pyridoxal-dependent decarboxylase, exosortase A system-associated n=1 Tax=unclassified Thioalkalivibrio TaxID=2621013 RepID=UPI0003615344|nr:MULTISPECIES: pyridoxal-dependent decarboxylase, exosortase A system-associated [unclassified Thioalkalivibrio]